MKSSFVKTAKAAQPTLLPGTRPSPFTAQVLCSSGLQTLDEILGGGVQIGSLFLLEEDENSRFFLSLLKYFIAEGVTTGHSVLLCSADAPPNAILCTTPQVILSSQTLSLQDEEEDKEGDDAQHLKIAWRYRKYLGSEITGSVPSPEQQQQAPVVFAPDMTRPSLVGGGASFCHDFDLNSPIVAEALAAARAVTESVDVQSLVKASSSGEGQISSNELFAVLYRRIAQFVAALGRQPIAARRVGRVVIHSLASPFWPVSHWSNENEQLGLYRFLQSIRMLMRTTPNCLCFVTMPSHLHSRSLVRKVQHSCDYVINMESFSGKGSGEAVPAEFQDIHGLLRIVKLAHINTLSPVLPDTLTYSFTQRRRKLKIEKLHPAPDTTGESRAKDADASSPAKVAKALSQASSSSGLVCHDE
mmetsp:Transcript_32835/g.53271  ORF Transcript_32835/g.53271 Transcript_32835/m.53271 type:complete len:415 (-) Transcript_32835:2-1246(-)